MGFVYCTFADVPPGVLNGGVAVHVGEQAKTESVAVVGGICEAIDEHTGRGSLECLSNTIVELVVNNRAPVLRFFIRHGLHICAGKHINRLQELAEFTVNAVTDTFNAHSRLYYADKLPGATDASRGSAVNLTHLHNYFFQNVPRSQ